MGNSAILGCTCRSEFQDKEHGQGNRVHSRTRKNDGQLFRCTVCSRERVAPGVKAEK